MKKRNVFPKSRPWDHAIDLIKVAPELLNCKVYLLPPGQQELLGCISSKNMKRRDIYIALNHPISFTFLLRQKERWQAATKVAKTYRQLNKYTVRNTYPLPLIKELINQLVKKIQWFTKFDIDDMGIQ